MIKTYKERLATNEELATRKTLNRWEKVGKMVEKMVVKRIICGKIYQ